MGERKFNISGWKSEARQHKNSVNVLANKEEHFPAQSLFILTFSDYKGLSMRMEIHMASCFQTSERRAGCNFNLIYKVEQGLVLKELCKRWIWGDFVEGQQWAEGDFCCMGGGGLRRTKGG